MNSITADGFLKAQRAREIIEEAIPTVFFIAFFGGWVVAAALAGMVAVEKMSQFFCLFIISALTVGASWWQVREIPKRVRAANKLKVLLFDNSTLPSMNPRRIFRAAGIFVGEERQKIVALLRDRLRPCLNVEQYDGRFIGGNDRFEMYQGVVPPTNRAATIMEEVELVNQEFNLSLQPSFVWGWSTGICVHVTVLGGDFYFG